MSMRAAWIIWFAFFGAASAVVAGHELATNGATPRAAFWLLALVVQCVPLSIELCVDWRGRKR